MFSLQTLAAGERAWTASQEAGRVWLWASHSPWCQVTRTLPGHFSSPARCGDDLSFPPVPQGGIEEGDTNRLRLSSGLMTASQHTSLEMTTGDMQRKCSVLGQRQKESTVNLRHHNHTRLWLHHECLRKELEITETLEI